MLAVIIMKRGYMYFMNDNYEEHILKMHPFSMGVVAVTNNAQ